MKGERIVAGLACSEVLARLSDYEAGELPAEERTRVEDHVRECEHCARFGGVFAEMVRSLRARLGAGPLPAGARTRLFERLERD